MYIYLVEADNGESYSAYHSWIQGAFTSYRKATQSLLDNDYQVYPKWNHNTEEYEPAFYWEESDEYMADCSFARIIEMELED